MFEAGKTLAPVVLFAYARPEHTRLTLDALAANKLASHSDLVIYADAACRESDEDKVREVREIIHAASGFRSIKIVERETNFGLAKNIVDGVSEVCDKNGRVIVLEDDIVTAPNFLSFMNAALERYENEPRVWHISGWNYPIDPEGLGEAFLWRVMNCWGWATWSNRWRHFSKDPARLIDTWRSEEIARFNLDGAHDFLAQVMANRNGALNTWAIFWYASIFENHGLCLNPARSFVCNIGNDGSGVNCGLTEDFSTKQLGACVENFPEVIEESALAVQRVKIFYGGMRRTFMQRLARYVKSLAPVMAGHR
ncbi:glycosyltransferase [Betaproteobacteria bacterium SCN2]|jgi:hypothetical protein|nr:glycosyltransferase [Betaproteobacteria bacterium SCN2]